MAQKAVVFNILKSLKNHMKLIGSIAVLSMAGVWALLAFILTPDYQATSQLYMSQLSAGASDLIYLEKTADPQIAEAYEAVIKSGEVLTEAIESTGSKLTPVELFDEVTVSILPSSQIITISVEDGNSRMAAEMANALAEAAVIEAQKRMKVDSLSVIAKASVEGSPSILKENLLYVLAIGGFVGTVVGILLASIIELFNMLFKTGVLIRKRKQSDLQTVFK
ncbi:YveK family protein [Planococcus beigongshangi]|uniref:YveK family protein n=1 Tax=Planococcus beigongshangi TaxID=2782536 RepID=UPI00193BC336|nr:Wzz/FepE/Etk N-terminal domain-containing protein [Planococcus beigongshangi]